MTKRNNKTSQPQPDISNDVQTAGEGEEMASNIAELPKLRSKGGLSQIANAETRQAGEKIALSGEVRQRLAEAADLSSKGELFADEAQAVSSTAIRLLYQGRSNGLLSNEEVSGYLGDVFGFKGTGKGKGKVFAAGHPNAGKTPAGLGEPIRKRVIRLEQAERYATSQDGEEVPTFFRGLDKEAVSQVLNEVENDNLTGWQAYGRFAEMKREASEKRVNPAFDAKKVVALAATLGTDEAINTLAGDPGLLKAYGTLLNVLRMIDDDPRIIAAGEEAQAQAA